MWYKKIRELRIINIRSRKYKKVGRVSNPVENKKTKDEQIGSPW